MKIKFRPAEIIRSLPKLRAMLISLDYHKSIIILFVVFTIKPLRKYMFNSNRISERFK